MNTIYYWKGAIGSADLVTTHATAIHNLLSGNYNNNDLEKMAGSSSRLIYSYRLNGKARLLFTSLIIKGQSCLHVLEHLPDHDYQKSRYLKKGVLQHEQNKNKDVFDATFSPITTDTDRPAFAPVDTTATLNHVGLDYFNKQFIQLSTSQNEVLRASFPMLITGVAGSGKSYVLLSIFSQCINNNTTHEPMRLLFVSKESHLVNEMRTNWNDLVSTQDIPNHIEVEFKAYHELISSSHDTIWVDKACFDAWIQGQKKSLNLDPAMIYQEFRICSGFSLDQYKALGERQSTLAIEKRETLYNLYQTYLKHLHQHHKIDPAFHPVNAAQEPAYDVVVVDESQNLTPLQQHYLSRLAKNRNIAYCMDPHQNLVDSCATRPLLEQLFWDPVQLINPMTTITLSKTFRCPPNIAKIADLMINIKHHVSGGKIDKQEATSLQVDDPLTSAGHVLLTTPDKLNSPEYAHILNRASGNHFAVVTRPELISDAKRRFNTPLVFTPEQIQGFEYDTLLVDQLNSNEASNAVFKAIKPKLADLNTTQARTTHRAKDGQSDHQHAAFINKLYTTYARARNTLIICENINRDNAPFFNLIRTSIPNTNAPETAVHETQPETDWLAEATQQARRGNQEQAASIYKEKLHKTADEIRSLMNLQDSITSAIPVQSISKNKPQKKPRLTAKEERLLALVNEYDSKKLMALLNDSDAFALLFDTRIRTESPFASLLDFITHSEERVKQFCVVMGICHKNLVNPQFVNTMIATQAPAPIHEKLLYILLTQPSVPMTEKKIKEWSATVNKENVLSLYTLKDMRTLVSNLLGRHALFTTIELAHAFSRISNQEKNTFIFIELLCGVSLQYPEMINLIPAATWGLAPTEGEHKNRTPLWWLTGDQNARALLYYWSIIYPASFTAIPAAAWGFAPTEGEHKNKTPLWWLTINHENSNVLLNTWISKHPTSFAAIPAAAWGLAPTEGEHKNKTPVWWLASTSQGIELLYNWFINDPASFAAIPSAAWGLAPTEGVNRGVSAILSLTGSSKGRVLLNLWCTQNPASFAAIPAAVWGLAKTDGENKNETPLLWLASTSEGLLLLSTWYTQNPASFAAIPATAWELAPTEGEYKNESPLFLITQLSLTDYFDDSFFDQYLAVFESCSKEAWCLEVVNSKNERISPLLNLARNPENKLLKALLNKHPDLRALIPPNHGTPMQSVSSPITQHGFFSEASPSGVPSQETSEPEQSCVENYVSK